MSGLESICHQDSRGLCEKQASWSTSPDSYRDTKRTLHIEYGATSGTYPTKAC